MSTEETIEQRIQKRFHLIDHMFRELDVQLVAEITIPFKPRRTRSQEMMDMVSEILEQTRKCADNFEMYMKRYHDIHESLIAEKEDETATEMPDSKRIELIAVLFANLIVEINVERIRAISEYGMRSYMTRFINAIHREVGNNDRMFGKYVHAVYFPQEI